MSRMTPSPTLGHTAGPGLPRGPRRVLIAGSGGSGKTTLAKRLGPVLGLPVHELDALYYGPDLHLAPTFPSAIERIAAEEAWLFDSQGPPADSEAPPEVRDLLWSRADTLIWLDYPRRVVVWRAVRRSLRRIITREPLWHGRRETPLWWLRADHPIRRSWRLGKVAPRRLAERLQDPRWQHLTVARLRHPRATRNWLRSVQDLAGGG